MIGSDDISHLFLALRPDSRPGQPGAEWCLDTFPASQHYMTSYSQSDHYYLGESVPCVMHDGVIIISQPHGVHLLRGELVEVVFLTDHHIFSFDLNPVVPRIVALRK